MKRKMELVRTILAKAECDDKGPGNKISGSDIARDLSDYGTDEVNYHIEIMDEGGLIHANVAHGNAGDIKGASVKRLTWDGHEFLDAAQNSDIWAQVQDAASEKSLSLTMDVMKNALKHYTEKKLGLKDE